MPRDRRTITQSVRRETGIPAVTIGAWSRRITQEHRCAYLIKSNRIELLQGRYHY